MMYDDGADLEEMAAFVVAFPGFTPNDYWNLSLRERSALVEAWNKANKQK